MIIKKSLAKIAIVPNVERIAREMTTTSQVGIILNRVKVLRLSSVVKIGVKNLPYLLKIVKKDFAVGIKVLTELEILKLLESGEIREIALHQQMVDMAVALDNRMVAQYLFEMAATYSFTPYLITCNVGPLIQMLSKIKKVPANLYIVTNISSDHGSMNPEYNDIIEYLEKSHLNFIDNKGKV